MKSAWFIYGESEHVMLIYFVITLNVVILYIYIWDLPQRIHLVLSHPLFFYFHLSKVSLNLASLACGASWDNNLVICCFVVTISWPKTYHYSIQLDCN